jgi:hypothetical protein
MLMLDKGADPNIVGQSSHFCQGDVAHPMHRVYLTWQSSRYVTVGVPSAVCYLNPSLIKFAIVVGWNFYQSPLIWAVSKRHDEVVHKLLACGADPDWPGGEFSCVSPDKSASNLMAPIFQLDKAIHPFTTVLLQTTMRLLVLCWHTVPTRTSVVSRFFPGYTRHDLISSKL